MNASDGASPTAYRDGVEIALNRGAAVVVGTFALAWLVVAAANGPRLDAPTLLMVIAFVAVGASFVWRAFRGAGRCGDIAALTLTAVLSPVVLTMSETALAPGLRNMPAVALAVVALGLNPSALSVGAVVLGSTAFFASEVAAQGARGAVESVTWVVTVAIAAQALSRALRAAGTRADRATADRGRLAAASVQATAQRSALREVQALLHDHVAAALRAISLPSLTRAEAVFAAADAVEALVDRPRAPDAGEEPPTLPALVRALPRPPGVTPVLEVTDVGHVPAQVARAFDRAARESLRNVGRHAGAAAAVTVRLATDGDAVVLSVEDDGGGFAPENPGGFGVERSIVRTMRDVGGDAIITSATGQGTLVRLTWRAPESGGRPPPRRSTYLRAALVDVRRPLAWVVLPYLAVAIGLALGYIVPAMGTHWPWLVWLIGLIGITVGVVIRADHDLPALISIPALAYAVGGAITSIVVLPEETLLIRDHGTWPIGSISPLLALLVVLRPPRETFAALGVLQSAVVVLTATGRLGEGDGAGRIMSVTPLVLSTVAPALLAFALGQFFVRLGRVVTEAEVSRRRVEAAQATEHTWAAVQARCLAGLDEEVVPFLREVTADRAPVSESTSRRARELELAVRDEMHLPGVLDHDAQEALRQARLAGARVTLRSDLSDDLPHEGLRDLIVAVLTPPSADLECILTVRGGGAETHVTVVAVPGDDGRVHRLWAACPEGLAIVEDSPDVLWAEWLPAAPHASPVGANAGEGAGEGVSVRTDAHVEE